MGRMHDGKGGRKELNGTELLLKKGCLKTVSLEMRIPDTSLGDAVERGTVAREDLEAPREALFRGFRPSERES
jgi:hypothetical protein